MRKTSGSGRVTISEQLVERYSVTLRGLKYLLAHEALQRCGGNYNKAAQILGVERTSLRRYLGDVRPRKREH
jgi:DNA-binding protein Fis